MYLVKKAPLLSITIIFSLWLLNNSCTNNNSLGPVYYSYDSTKFNQIVSSILKDTFYFNINNVESNIVDSTNEIIEKIKLCCEGKKELFPFFKYPIYTKEIVFYYKRKCITDTLELGSAIRLIEWKLRDTSLALRMDTLLKCGDIHKCGTVNAYHYYRVKNLIYFSRVFSYENQYEFKDILKNVSEVYK